MIVIFYKESSDTQNILCSHRTRRKKKFKIEVVFQLAHCYLFGFLNTYTTLRLVRTFYLDN